MEKISSSKISLQSSNPKYAYPIVRLPREYKEIAGKTAQIYKTNHQGSLAFLVVVDKSESEQYANSVESRLSRIESQIGEIMSVIKPNKPRSTEDHENGHGLAEIRTQDLRRVKATS